MPMIRTYIAVAKTNPAAAMYAGMSLVYAGYATFRVIFTGQPITMIMGMSMACGFFMLARIFVIVAAMQRHLDEQMRQGHGVVDRKREAEAAREAAQVRAEVDRAIESIQKDLS